MRTFSTIALSILMATAAMAAPLPSITFVANDESAQSRMTDIQRVRLSCIAEQEKSDLKPSNAKVYHTMLTQCLVKKVLENKLPGHFDVSYRPPAP